MDFSKIFFIPKNNSGTIQIYLLKTGMVVEVFKHIFWSPLCLKIFWSSILTWIFEKYIFLISMLFFNNYILSPHKSCIFQKYFLNPMNNCATIQSIWNINIWNFSKIFFKFQNWGGYFLKIFFWSGHDICFWTFYKKKFLSPLKSWVLSKILFEFLSSFLQKILFKSQQKLRNYSKIFVEHRNNWGISQEIFFWGLTKLLAENFNCRGVFKYIFWSSQLAVDIRIDVDFLKYFLMFTIDMELFNWNS